jgi:hypothetical protein
MVDANATSHVTGRPPRPGRAHDPKEPGMNRLVRTIACATALALLACSTATAVDDPTKPVLRFTPICAVSGFENYGLCSGPTSLSNIRGTVGQSQARRGHWLIRLTFSGLTPGSLYRLWGNRDGLATPGQIGGFFPIATGRVLPGGVLWFDVDTTNPENLAFDLNQIRDESELNGTTVVTSYWSRQFLHVNPDLTLSSG